MLLIWNSVFCRYPACQVMRFEITMDIRTRPQYISKHGCGYDIGRQLITTQLARPYLRLRIKLSSLFNVSPEASDLIDADKKFTLLWTRHYWWSDRLCTTSCPVEMQAQYETFEYSEVTSLLSLSTTAVDQISTRCTHPSGMARICNLYRRKTDLNYRNAKNETEPAY